MDTQETKYEKVGAVTLDLTKYSGKDLYCDGAVEDTLLSIVKDHTPEEYPQIIASEKNWPVLYHLSELRENIIDWIRIPKEAKVLEIGSGCGAITGALSRKAKSVTCVELSRKRSMINAYRHRDAENITIRVGNFEDIEPMLENDYDFIFLIGVYEYAGSYIHADNPYTRFLDIIKQHKKADGQIVIAIENRLGLKYFAGAREDHLGNYFSGIEDYPEGGPAKTFSKPALEKHFAECGFEHAEFYYPYPDYKFMSTLYSDRRLPQEGELTTNLLNLDRERILLFNEKNAYDAILRDGLYPVYANSYLVLLGGNSEVVYSKYSNDRAKEYAIRTDILEWGGERIVEKVPMQKDASVQLLAIGKAGEALQKRYEGSGLMVCPCRKVGETDSYSLQQDSLSSDKESEEKETVILRFPYLSGSTLEQALDEAMRQMDQSCVKELLGRYYGYVTYHTDADVTDMDMIFSNILIAEDGTWQLIDYEWTEYRAIPVREVVARAIYVYLSGDPGRMISDEILRDVLHMDRKDYDAEALKKQEESFQKKIMGDRTPLGGMNALIANPIWKLTGEMGARDARKDRMQAQIYYDHGSGFSEADSEALKITESADGIGIKTPVIIKNADESYCLTVTVKEDLRAVRFDPCRTSCIFTIEELRIGSMPVKKRMHNGHALSKQSIIFCGEDPNLTIPLKKQHGELVIKYRITEIDPKIAAEVCG